MTRFTLPTSVSLASVSLALLSLTIGGCAGDTGYTAAKVCAPNATQACTCSDGMSGAQVCASTGGSWGACLCTGSNPNPNPPPSWPDSGVGGTDSGIAPGGTPGTPAPGGTGTSTCAQIDSCMMACAETDNTCVDNCFYQGTANAQALMQAFDDCLNTAEQGSCQTQCANFDQACWDCIDQACQTQLNTCLSN